MKSYIAVLLSLFCFTSFANERRADCINAIIREAPQRNGSAFSYLEDHKILVENRGEMQWVYVDHGATKTIASSEYFICLQEELSLDDEPNNPTDLNRKVLSLFEAGYASSSNPRQYLNTLLAPCRRSGMTSLINRLNGLSSGSPATSGESESIPSE